MSCEHTPVQEDCIFCKIVAGKLPSARVYEDDHIIAFLDINPTAKGHTLVVPKGHYDTLLELPDCLGEAVLRALRLVATAVYQETKADGFNCLQNNFRSAGQMVFHSHWHVIPRYDNDGLADWPPGTSYADSDEMQQLAKSINSRIARRLTGGSHE